MRRRFLPIPLAGRRAVALEDEGGPDPFLGDVVVRQLDAKRWELVEPLPTAASLSTRAGADGLFRRSMEELEVPFARRWRRSAEVRAGSQLSDATRRHMLPFVISAPLSVLYAAVPALVGAGVPGAVLAHRVPGLACQIVFGSGGPARPQLEVRAG